MCAAFTIGRLVGLKANLPKPSPYKWRAPYVSEISVIDMNEKQYVKSREIVVIYKNISVIIQTLK